VHYFSRVFKQKKGETPTQFKQFSDKGKKTGSF